MSRRQGRQSIVRVGKRNTILTLVPILDSVSETSKITEDGIIVEKSLASHAASGSSISGKAKLSHIKEMVEHQLPHIQIRALNESDYDRYGFYIADDPTSSQSFHKAKQIESRELKQRVEKELFRSKKWKDMLDGMEGIGYSAKPAAAKIKERIRKGIPNDHRERAWYHISGAGEWAARHPTPNLSYTGNVSARVLDEIERDIDRTYPKHRIFSDVASGGDNSGSNALRNVLRWYAELDPEVGYCQGMGFLAGLFVIYMDEVRAFHTFCACMQNKVERPQLRTLYLPSMAETQCALFVFGELGRVHLGRTWKHMLDQGMHPTMYATEWLMTMFCRGFSFDLVTRVMDVYFSEGYKIVYRVGLALIKNIEQELLDADFETIMQIVRNIPVLTDASEVMDIAWKIPIKHADIDALHLQYEQLTSGESGKGVLGSDSQKAIGMDVLGEQNDRDDKKKRKGFLGMW